MTDDVVLSACIYRDFAGIDAIEELAVCSTIETFFYLVVIEIQGCVDPLKKLRTPHSIRCKWFPFAGITSVLHGLGPKAGK